MGKSLGHAASATWAALAIVALGCGRTSLDVPTGHGANLTTVVAADMDGDGKRDLAVAGPSSGVAVLRNQGDGTFALLGPVSGGSGSLGTFAAVDLNGDDKKVSR